MSWLIENDIPPLIFTIIIVSLFGFGLYKLLTINEKYENHKKYYNKNYNKRLF